MNSGVVVHKLTAKDAFLDSSILLSRKFGLPKQKANIRKKLKSRRKFSTEYAKTEIKRTFLKDAIFLHSLMVDEGTLTSVYQRLRTYPTTQRQKDRCLAILESVSDRRQVRFADAIVRLENLINGMEKEMLRNVQILKSGTGCQLASEEIEYDAPYFSIKTSCSRKTAVCLLHEHVTRNSAVLRALKVGVSNSLQFKKLSETLDIVLQNPEKAKGKNCKILGDTLICLDAPDNCDIFSTNVKDFGPICASLCKSFVGI
jgi:hypothetical protein